MGEIEDLDLVSLKGEPILVQQPIFGRRNSSTFRLVSDQRPLVVEIPIPGSATELVSVAHYLRHTHQMAHNPRTRFSRLGKPVHYAWDWAFGGILP